MTIFGVIWLVLSFFCFVVKDIRYMLGLTLIGMIFQCNNVITFKSISVGPQLITSLLLIAKYLLYRQQKENNTSNKFRDYSFAFLILYIILNSFFVSASTNPIFDIIQVIIYFLTFCILTKIGRLLNEEDIDRIVRTISIVLLLVGAVQIFANILHLDNLKILRLLVYNEITNMNIYYYAHPYTIRFYSTFMEPSYASVALVPLTLYFFYKNNKLYFILLLFSVFLTFSTTAYVLLIFLFGIEFIKRIKYKKTWLYFIYILILLIIVALGTNVLDRVLLSKSTSGSGVVRNMWNNRAYQAFLKAPIFGNGYKSLRASSIILDILGELGLTGLILYLYTMFKKIWVSFLRIDSKRDAVGLIFLTSAVLAQVISCPDLDLCSFWLCLYLYAIMYVGKKKRRKED